MERKETYCLINIKCVLFEKNESGEDFRIEEKSRKILIPNNDANINSKFNLIEKILGTKIKSKEDTLFSKIKKHLKRHIYLWKYEYYELLKL